MPDHSGDVTPQPEPFDLRSRAIVQAVTHFNDANVIAEVSRGLGDCMPGLDVRSMTGAEAAPGSLSLHRLCA